MAGIVRTLTKKLFISLNILLALCFLTACLVPYLHPARWWPVGFVGLLFPYVAILLFFYLIFWLIIKPRLALLPLFCLLAGWQQFASLFAFHFNKNQFSEVKIDPQVRVLSWNVGSMSGASKNKEKQKHARTEIADAIIKSKADIVCLQEFSHSSTQGPQANNLGLFKNDYPWHFYSQDYSRRQGFYQYGSVIFSRYPIIDSGKISYPGKRSESLIYVDILKAKDTIRIFTTHLQSFRFNDSDYQDMEKIKQQDSALFNASRNLYKKMQLAFTRRAIQADIVRGYTDGSPFPSLICGDFNDVPTSYTYSRIRGNRQDAFLACDFGIGRTYIDIAPTLRIDYILPDHRFTIHQFDMVDEDLSDHLMLLADLSLKK
ncbi:endonuclease/exonuclease/phosphatase family protein [Deminuibacter soli]|nr:endonuclease/exonuclease/phosphatase family protein [Deminuibacter soli]